MEEVYQKLTDDMEAFNIRAENGFDEYTGIFDNFIAEYGQNLAELQELAHMQVEIMDSTSLLGKNNATLNANTGSLKVQTQNTDYLRDAINAASSGNLEQAMKYLKMRNEKVRQTGINYGTDSKEAYERVMQAYNSRGNVGYGGSAGNYRGYAEGIENGPVTETGLAMLHGSENNPEYVLNSDQAGQMLENLSTQDMSNVDSRIESGVGSATTSTSDAGTSTIGVTGNARTPLEGINKIITQISGVINQEALTTSQLIQAVSILRSLKESQDLLYQIMNTDVMNDEARFNELKEYLDTVIQKLWEYLDGYNEKLDTGNATLSDILEQAQLGVEAINNLAEGIQGLMNTMSAMQD